MKKIALITGITGQDGSYLSEFLLDNEYEVHGILRRSSAKNTQRIEHLLSESYARNGALTLHYGDLSDSSGIINLLNKIQPDEVYNLGAQSHVKVSFDTPEYTSDVNGIGTLRLLEGIKLLGLGSKTRFYQASTSELYGDVKETPQTEKTPFNPRSPYAIAKLYSYWMTLHFREAYDIYACSGILFNHESPRREEHFVTRKITLGLSKIALGLKETLFMGNINSKRDWGHAKDYVKMQWLMLQQKHPKDYVIATGKQYSVKQFIKWAAEGLGIEIEFSGVGINEIAKVKSIKGSKAPAVKVGQEIIKISESYYRPTEVDSLLGDPTKARTELGWEPTFTAHQICLEMIEADYNLTVKTVSKSL